MTGWSNFREFDSVIEVANFLWFLLSLKFQLFFVCIGISTSFFVIYSPCENLS